MKKLLVALFALGTLTANAQTFKDTFDSNSMGWTEISGKDGEAVIKEGVMHLEGKKSGGLSLLGGVKDASEIMTHCFTNIDVQKNFEIKCKANVKKINENNMVGIVLDYWDDRNLMLFAIDDKQAYFLQYRDGDLVGVAKNLLKVTKKKDTRFDFSIKSTYKKLEFFVNGMLALELRYRDLISNGVGFYTYGAQVADFDDLELIQ